jgi:lipoprotein
MKKSIKIALVAFMIILTGCVKDQSRKSISTQLLQSQNPDDLMESYGIDKSQYSVSIPDNVTYYVTYKGVTYNFTKDFDLLLEAIERK